MIVKNREMVHSFKEEENLLMVVKKKRHCMLFCSFAPVCPPGSTR